MELAVAEADVDARVEARLDPWLGENTSAADEPWLRLGYYEAERLRSNTVEEVTPIATVSYRFAPDEYGAVTYSKTAQVMKNLGAVLTAAGVSFDHVVRCTIFLVDLADFAVVNKVYGQAFRTDPPARATVQVAALPKGARVEIDAIAVG